MFNRRLTRALLSIGLVGGLLLGTAAVVGAAGGADADEVALGAELTNDEQAAQPLI